MPTNPTDAQRQASRRNGAHSRGPKSQAGKARSALNGLRHGERAATVVLTNESPELYEQLRATYIDRLQPTDQIELDLVTQMVNAQWRLRRLYSHETALVDIEMALQRKDISEVFAKIDPESTTAIAFKSIAVHDTIVLERIDRMEQRYSRQFDRAMRSLLLLRRNSTSEPEPEPRSTVSENISPTESSTSEPTPTPAASPQPEHETGEPSAAALPDTNATEENVYQRYEFHPGRGVAPPQTASRFHDALHRQPKPAGDQPV